MVSVMYTAVLGYGNSREEDNLENRKGIIELTMVTTVGIIQSPKSLTVVITDSGMSIAQSSSCNITYRNIQ